MKSINKLDSKIISSVHINFLFGSGVNGKAFPQLEKFDRTVSLIKDKLSKLKEPTTYSNFEQSIDELGKTDIKAVSNQFKNEFKEYHGKIDWKHESIQHIKEMFVEVNKLVENAENRTKTMKQINIYTLNYDDIVDRCLDNLGYLYNIISSRDFLNHEKFFNLVGYNYELGKFIPTYLISKIHGDISDPILPGFAKYDSVLMEQRFQLIFQMKQKLSRKNSVLVVIGYSGNDRHINAILKDCILSGLTIYWMKYSAEDIVPEELSEQVFVIENKETPTDMTKVFAEMVGELWGLSLVE